MELVVLVTPHLVDPMACNQVPHLLPGQETRTPDDCELFLEGILEAPRGPRDSWPGGHYLAPYKNGPTSEVFPCAGGHGGLGHGSTCGSGCGGNCGTAGCGTTSTSIGAGHLGDASSKPLPVAGTPPAPGEISKSTDATPPLPPAVLPSTEPAKAPAVLPSETTKAPAGPAGEDLSPGEAPAKAPKPFLLPSVGETRAPEGPK
jgi:hypothetical protein